MEIIILILIATVAVVYLHWKTRPSGKDFQWSEHQETDAIEQWSAGQQETKILSGSTYYELLGVDRNATEGQIRKAWRKKDHEQYLPIELRRAYHSAFKTLSDPEERRRYDAKPWQWVYEDKPNQRRGEKLLSQSIENSGSGRQTVSSSVHSSSDSHSSNQGKNGTDRGRGIGTQLDRSGGYSPTPRRTYRTRSSYSLCPACSWRQNTIRSGRAWSIKGVDRWASNNCTCRR